MELTLTDTPLIEETSGTELQPDEATDNDEARKLREEEEYQKLTHGATQVLRVASERNSRPYSMRFLDQSRFPHEDVKEVAGASGKKGPASPGELNALRRAVAAIGIEAAAQVNLAVAPRGGGIYENDKSLGDMYYAVIKLGGQAVTQILEKHPDIARQAAREAIARRVRPGSESVPKTDQEVDLWINAQFHGSNNRLLRTIEAVRNVHRR